MADPAAARRRTVWPDSASSRSHASRPLARFAASIHPQFTSQYLTFGLPVLRPGPAFMGIFTFIKVWQLNGIYGTDYSVVMAGAMKF